MAEQVAERKGTFASGAAWMVAARFAERLLGLASTVVLARLLAPSDFGLVAMAMVFVAAADLLGAFGLDWALVRQAGLERRHLDTAWTIRTCLGLASFGALAAMSVPAAHIYREPRVTPMILFLGVSLLIGAVENPGVVIFRRNMDFAKEFRLRTTAKVMAAMVAISAAIALRSYWALLFGTLTGRATATVMSYVMHPHRPRPSLEARRELLGFSAWLWLGNILGFLRVRVVELMLGRMVGPKDLGLFSVSNELAQLASTEVSAPINRALFSAYAQHGTRADAVARAYEDASPVIWAVTLPVVVGTYLTAPQLVLLVLGPQWHEAVPLLRTLALAGAAGLFSTGAVQVYWAVDRARVESLMEACWVTTLLTLVLILTPRYGVHGAAVAALTSCVVLAPTNMVLLRRFAGVSIRTTIERTWRIVAACAAMFGAVSWFAAGWTQASSGEALRQLAAMAAAGSIAYVAALSGLWWLSGRPEGPERAVIRLLARRLRIPASDHP